MTTFSSSFTPPSTALGGLDGRQAACQSCCHHPGARAESPDQTGKGHRAGEGYCRKCFHGLKSRRKTEGKSREPSLEGAAHQPGKAWLPACCSKTAKGSCHPQAAPQPLQTPSPVFIWPAES